VISSTTYPETEAEGDIGISCSYHSGEYCGRIDDDDEETRRRKIERESRIQGVHITIQFC